MLSPSGLSDLQRMFLECCSGSGFSSIFERNNANNEENLPAAVEWVDRDSRVREKGCVPALEF